MHNITKTSGDHTTTEQHKKYMCKNNNNNTHSEIFVSAPVTRLSATLRHIHTYKCTYTQPQLYYYSYVREITSRHGISSIHPISTYAAFSPSCPSVMFDASFLPHNQTFSRSYTHVVQFLPLLFCIKLVRSFQQVKLPFYPPIYRQFQLRQHTAYFYTTHTYNSIYLRTYIHMYMHLGVYMYLQMLCWEKYIRSLAA